MTAAGSRPARVAILGGGQLARMLAMAGLPLGIHSLFLDPAADACAGPVGELCQAGFDDARAAAALAARADLVTFDFENVPAATARAAAAVRPLRPGIGALEACQDRGREKQLLASLDIAVPAWHPVDGRRDLLEAVERLAYPCVLKTRRFGYDGKGQVLLRGPEDLEPGWQTLGERALIAEAYVPFAAECSLLAVRGIDGTQRCWPLTRNLHRRGVLLMSGPGRLPVRLQAQAEAIAGRLLQHFDYVGVLAVEFFLHQGRLLVNELAPRVHNSGHWTLDGAETSQFENHLRAICGLPLGATRPTSPAVMFNWIGALPERDRVLAVPGVHWHAYGKRARPGRKLGHATVTAPDAAELDTRCERLVAILGQDWPAHWQAFRQDAAAAA